MKKSTLLSTTVLLLLIIVSFASFFYKELLILTQCISLTVLVIILLRLTKWKYEQPIAIQENYVLIPHRKRSLYYSNIEMIQFNAEKMSLDIVSENGERYTLEAVHRQDFLKLVQAARNANPTIYVEDSLPLDELSYQKLIDEYLVQKEVDRQQVDRYNLLYIIVITLTLIVTTSISVIQ